jgi:hypothetical protein
VAPVTLRAVLLPSFRKTRESQLWYSHFQKWYGESSKLKELPYEPAIPLLGVHLRIMESVHKRAVFTPYVHYSVIHNS